MWISELLWKRVPGAEQARHAIKPIYLFESTVRTWLVHAPRVLSQRLPSFNRTISLLFMYMMFQVLAILGAFLLNAICSVTLDISGLAAKHAFDFSLNRSIAHGFATFYVTYSTIRVFVRFGQAIGVIAWESLDDFPDARKIVSHATSQWPMFIFIMFIPQCLMALSLVGTPWLCKGVTAPDTLGGVLHPDASGLNQAFPFQLKWPSLLDAAGEGRLADRLQSFVCTRTPLLYLTSSYPSPRRTMSAVLVVGLVQYMQILLHRFPSWRADMRPSSTKGRLCVHFSLLACLTLTGRWLVGWVFFQLGLDLAGHALEEWVRGLFGAFGDFLLGVWRLTFGGMDDIQESGRHIIMAWTLWVLIVAYVLCVNASSAAPKDRELRSFFQNLKTSFIVAVTFFFLRGCASPTMGFIEAQQELTILTIVIPILYVALYTTVNAALQMSIGLVVVGGPIAMCASVNLCQSSGFGGPGTFVVVFLHMFIKLLKLFGDDDLTHLERDGYDEDDARGRSRSFSTPGTPRLRSFVSSYSVPSAAGGAGVSDGGNSSSAVGLVVEVGHEDGGAPNDGDALSYSAGAVREREGEPRPGVGGDDREDAGAGAEAAGGGDDDGDGNDAAGGGGGGGGGGGKSVDGRERPRATERASGGREASLSGGSDGVASGDRRSESLFAQEPPQVIRRRRPQEEEQRERGGTRRGDDVPRRSRALSASPSSVSGSARHRLNSVQVPLQRGLPLTATSALPGASNSNRDGRANGVGDDRTSRTTGVGDDELSHAGAAFGSGVGGDVAHQQQQQYQLLRRRRRPSVRGWKSERTLTPRSASAQAAAAGAAATPGGVTARAETGTGTAVTGKQERGATAASDRRISDALPLSSLWGSFGGDDGADAVHAGWGELAGSDWYQPGWQYAGAGGVERGLKRRSLSMDELHSLSTSGWDELGVSWGRRNTGDHSTSSSSMIGSSNFRGGGAGRGRTHTGSSSTTVHDDPQDGAAAAAAGGGGGGGFMVGDQHRDQDQDYYISRRPAWMRSGVASGVASSLAAAMETNAQFVFKGTMRGGCALLAILSLFLASCQIISMLQEQHEWYPSLIKYSRTDSNQLVVNNAFVVKATLETTGDPVIEPPRYASCGFKWHGLSLLDYALLAELAYFDQHDDEVPLSEVAKQFFPLGKSGPDFKIKVKQGDDLHSHAQFFEAYSAKLNVSVIAIRGTDVGRISDLIEDIKIWVEPIVLKVLSMVFPTIRIWPDSTSSVVIEWLHETLQLFGLQQQAHYYRPLLEHVRSITGREVVLTGHSLGGGLARIVGALEKATSICFSPPGIAQSYRKFSVGASALDRDLLHRMSVSVIPDYDFVPMIDTQVGLIQMISCDTAGKALQLSCHMLEGTICEIIRHCGDDRGRFTDCNFEYNMSHLVPQMLILLQGHWVWIGALLLLTGIAGVLLFVSEFVVTHTKSSLPLLDDPAKVMAP